MAPLIDDIDELLDQYPPETDLVRRLEELDYNNDDQVGGFLELLASEPDADTRRTVIARVLARNRQMTNAVEELQGTMTKLERMVEELTTDPRPLAKLIRTTGELPTQQAEVVYRGDRLHLDILDEMQGNPGLVPGARVILSAKGNVIVDVATFDAVGEVGTIAEIIDDASVIVESEGRSHRLPRLDPRHDYAKGDRVCFDPEIGILDLLPPAQAADDLFRTRFPAVGPEVIGGRRQREIFDRLLWLVKGSVVHRDRAREYGVADLGSIVLLHGKPGNCKSRMLQVLASVLQHGNFNSAPVAQAVVRPGELLSCWYGVSELRVRNTFRHLRDLAAQGYIVILHLEEVETLGRTRGEGLGSSHHEDRVLAALLTEIEGLDESKNVVVVGTTNRLDLLDSALLSRFGTQLYVPRPDYDTAVEVFHIHLPETVPCANDGVREEAIESTCGLLFSPDATICELSLEDGSHRVVTAQEVLSGRMIAKTCQAAIQAAFKREMESGSVGLRVEDVRSAALESCRQASAAITVRNVREHLDGLSRDNRVIDVTPLHPADSFGGP